MAAPAWRYANPPGTPAAAECARIRRSADGFDAGIKAPLQKMQQCFPVQREAIGQIEHETARGSCARPAPELCGIQPVVRLERIVETPQAGEAARESDVSNGQCRISQQHLRCQQPLGLQQPVWRNAKFILNHTPQMALTDTHLRGQRSDADFVQGALFYAPAQRDCEPVARIHECVAGRVLWPAAQAGTESGLLRGRGAPVERAIAFERTPGVADKATVNPGGRNTDVHQSVETSITADECLVTAVRIEFHGAHLADTASISLAIFGHAVRIAGYDRKALANGRSCRARPFPPAAQQRKVQAHARRPESVRVTSQLRCVTFALSLQKCLDVRAFMA